MNTIIKDDISKLISQEKALLESAKGKTILITGATGMIGQYLTFLFAELSKQSGFESTTVIAHARNLEKAEILFSDYLDHNNFRIQACDILDLNDIDGPLDYCFHAASPAQPKDFKERPVDIIKANVLATDNLLQLCAKKSAKFCFISTMEVYGEVHSDSYPVKVNEEAYGSLDSLNLRSAYPESKRLAENLCVAYQEQFQVPVSIARLTHTYGPGMSLDDGRVQAIFMKKALSGETPVVKADDSGRRTYTYIADAIMGAIYTILKSTPDNFVFNIANESSMLSIRELAEQILIASGRDKSDLQVDIDQDTSMLSKSNGIVLVDTTRAKALGWTPQYNIEDGMARTIKYHTGK
jgi:Nucleoside-diphosphate-sugar epimerases